MKWIGVRIEHPMRSTWEAYEQAMSEDHGVGSSDHFNTKITQKGRFLLCKKTKPREQYEHVEPFRRRSPSACASRSSRRGWKVFAAGSKSASRRPKVLKSGSKSAFRRTFENLWASKSAFSCNRWLTITASHLTTKQILYEFYTCDYKAAIERERSEARFDSAEREQARP